MRRDADDGSPDRTTTAEAGTNQSADEALLYDHENHLVEGTTSNLFFVSEGVVHTPSTTEPLLPGITRAVVLDLARQHDIPAETGRYTIADVREATEVFLTNTTWEIRPITTIDGSPLDNDSGTTTSRLQELFDELVENRHY